MDRFDEIFNDTTPMVMRTACQWSYKPHPVLKLVRVETACDAAPFYVSSHETPDRCFVCGGEIKE